MSEIVDHLAAKTVPSWKMDPNSRVHPLHSMMARAGSFPASLADYFIQAYSGPRDIVFDPFCGRGTAILEAVLGGRKAIGSDVAPEAVACTRAKVTPITFDEVSDYIDTLIYRRYALSTVPAEAKVFYHPRTLSRLLCVRDQLQRDSKSGIPDLERPATFLLGCLLGILHGHASYSLSLSCSHVFAMAPNYVRKYVAEHNLECPERDVRECLKAKSRILLSDGSAPPGLAEVYESSADRYSFDNGRLSNQVSLIVSSPPYLNAQTYAKDAWLRLWLLGYDYRQVRSRYLQTASVATYREKMKPCLREMLRVLKPDGYAFLVAGDVFISRKGRKVPVRTAEILAEIAETLEATDGFKFQVDAIVEDRIPSHARCYSAVHKDANAHWDEKGNGTGVRIDRIMQLCKVPA
jgi:site-specific DNA-methyltransferase (adenine-specific)